MERLAGHVAIVTLGGGGTGRDIVARLARAGATVVIADPDAERSDAAAAEIRHAWGTVAVQVVHPHKDDPAKLVADTVRTCGGLDALVLLMDETGAVALDVLDAALPQLTARGHGLVAIVDPQDAPRIGALEEALSEARRRIGREPRENLRCYGITSLPPGGGDIGAALVQLAATRPEGEIDGRLVLVPPL